ncbi:MAG: hypothetical protein SGARI_001766 [Bacillariaceae sp.]
MSSKTFTIENPYSFVFGRGGGANKCRGTCTEFNKILNAAAPKYKTEMNKKDFVKNQIYNKVTKKGGKFYQEVDGVIVEFKDVDDILVNKKKTVAKAKASSGGKKKNASSAAKKGKATAKAKASSGGKKKNASSAAKKGKATVHRTKKQPARAAKKMESMDEDRLQLGLMEEDAHSVAETVVPETMESEDDLLSLGDVSKDMKEDIASLGRSTAMPPPNHVHFQGINKVSMGDEDAEEKADATLETGEDDEWLSHIQPPPLECQHSLSGPMFHQQHQQLGTGAVTMPVGDYQNLLAKLAILQNENAMLKAEKRLLKEE